LEHIGLEGKIILKWIFKTWDGGMDWIDLDQDQKRWWALMNAVMIFGFHNMRRITYLAADVLASQKGLCSMELR
jgi:sugar lactone lactonase YvrE